MTKEITRVYVLMGIGVADDGRNDSGHIVDIFASEESAIDAMHCASHHLTYRHVSVETYEVNP